MKELLEFLHAHDQHTRELDSMEATEKRSKAEIDAVLEDGKIDDAKEQQKLATARLRLDLIPMRKKRILDNLPDLEKASRHALSEHRRTLSQAMRRAREAKLDELAEALAPFYTKLHKRELRKLAESLKAPAVVEIGNLESMLHQHYEAGSKVPFGEQMREYVRAAKRLEKFLGLN